MSRNTTLAVLSSIIFLFVSSLLLISLFLFFSCTGSNENVIISGTSTYQYQEYDTNSSTLSNGFVAINTKLADGEFISYPNSQTGSTIIITNFADSQYECSGSCICSSSQRRSTSVLTRSLYILFSALSSSLAFKIAEQSFRDQCLVQFSSTCDDENISSEVQSCSEKEENDNENDKEYAEFSCEGHCLTNLRIRSPSGLQAQQDFFDNEGKCKDFKTSAQIKVRRIARDITDSVVLKTGEVKTYHKRFKQVNSETAQTFIRKNLVPFCKEMSRWRYLYASENPNGAKQTQWRTASMCGGRSKDETKRTNVKCKQISGRVAKI